MKIIVSGGRNYNDRERMYDVLDELLYDTPIDFLNHGGATGADTLAGEWASERNVKTIVHRADWENLTDGRVKIATNRYGKKYNAYAGPNRNISMLKSSKSELVICFPGGNGTRHMLNYAIKYGVETWEVKKDIGIQIYNIENRKYGQTFKI